MRQALVAKAAVEALDVSVLHRLSRLDEAQFDTVCRRPCLQRPTGELRTVVVADDLGQSTLGFDLVWHARDVQCRDEVSAIICTDSLLQSSTTVNVFTRRPSASSSNTKSILHTSFGCIGRISAGAPAPATSCAGACALVQSNCGRPVIASGHREYVSFAKGY